MLMQNFQRGKQGVLCGMLKSWIKLTFDEMTWQYQLWISWEKIFFTSRKCVEEWKLAIYHLHGQTIHFMVYNFTQKSHLSFAQRSPSYWKMTTKAWNRNQRWVWRNVTQIFMWNILGQTTSCCLQSFFFTETSQKVVFNLR